MRIIIIISLLWLTACTTFQQQPQYDRFAMATANMAEAMRQHIEILQDLDLQAQQTSQALSFVREGGSLKKPPQNFTASLTMRLEFLDNLQEAVEARVFITAQQQNRLSRLAQAIHAESHKEQISEAWEESHSTLQSAIAVMVTDWQSEAMQNLPSDIIANLNANEERLLLLARKDNSTSILDLHQRTLQHLQNQTIRKKFLQNWQSLASLAELMQQAHLSFDDLQKFYDATLEFNNE